MLAEGVPKYVLISAVVLGAVGLVLLVRDMSLGRVGLVGTAGTGSMVVVALSCGCANML